MGKDRSEKQIKEEEKAVFLWLMKVVHEEKPEWVSIWYDYFNGAGAMHLDWQFNKRIEPYDYTSKYGKGCIACNRLISKMVATGKAEVLENTGSYKVIKFSFI